MQIVSAQTRHIYKAYGHQFVNVFSSIIADALLNLESVARQTFDATCWQLPWESSAIRCKRPQQQEALSMQESRRKCPCGFQFADLAGEIASGRLGSPAFT